MTVRFDNSADELLRTSNVLDFNSNYTIMMWAYISVDTNASTTIFSVNEGSLTTFDIFGHDGDGTTTRLGSRAASLNIVTGTNLTVGTWHHYAMVRRSTSSLELYIDGVLDITVTTDVSARTSSSEMNVGVQIGNVAVFNGRVHDIKEWSGVDLTTAEIRTEMTAVRPIRLAGLTNFTPILAGATGRTRAYIGSDWTEVGTLTDEDPPPIGWGNSAQIIPFVASGAPETITADSGSYVYTGTTTPIRADFNTVSEIGSYSLTGTTTPLQALLNIIPVSGSYALSGTNIDLRFGSTITVDAGSYTYTGTLVNLDIVANMTIDSGSYIISGTDTPLLDAANIWTDQAITPAVWVDGIEQSTTWTDESLTTTTTWTDI